MDDPREPPEALPRAHTTGCATDLDPRAALLARHAPATLAAALTKDDPLGLRARVREHLDAEALLLDEGRLFLRAAARAAHGARSCPPDRDGFDAWLASLVRRAAGGLLVEDKEALECGIPPSAAWDPAAPSLLERLPIEPALARAVAVTFNRLPDGERRIFYALVIRGTSVEHCAAEMTMTPESLRAVVRDVLHRLCRLDRGAARGSVNNHVPNPRGRT